MMYSYNAMTVRLHGVGSQAEPTPYTAGVGCYLKMSSAFIGRDI